MKMIHHRKLSTAATLQPIFALISVFIRDGIEGEVSYSCYKSEVCAAKTSSCTQDDSVLSLFTVKNISIKVHHHLLASHRASHRYFLPDSGFIKQKHQAAQRRVQRKYHSGVSDPFFVSAAFTGWRYGEIQPPSLPWFTDVWGASTWAAGSIADTSGIHTHTLRHTSTHTHTASSNLL